jgi:carbon-monoxide dehydrogenase small subunit
LEGRISVVDSITLTVNGEDYEVLVDRNETLMSVLREKLDLTGVKPGCETGDCGACKVIIDGEAVNSCLIQARKAVGKDIKTIEGLAGPDGLHIIQEAFVEAGAVQCGYCTPGMVMSTKALLDKNDDPTESEIREALSNNLCRCTGYVKIVEAVKNAALRLRVSSDYVGDAADTKTSTNN